MNLFKMGRKKRRNKTRAAHYRSKETVIPQEKLTCMYCLEEVKIKEFFKACKCKGSHIAHKECIEEFIRRNNYRCSVCDTEYNIKYQIPTTYEVFKLIIKEYYNNFVNFSSKILSNIVSFGTFLFESFIESSIFFFKNMLPFLSKVAFCIFIIYLNYRFNYYLYSKFFYKVDAVYRLRIVSFGSLYINYAIFDFFVNISRDISRKKKEIIQNKSSKFEILPYQEESRFI
jgi:hypothetical protein